MITCTLGALSIPLSNASVRVNTTSLSISATSPAVDLAEQIGALSGADLVLSASGVEIARAPLGSVRLDLGARAASITLSADAPTPATAPKALPVYGVSYRPVTAGKRRYRCALLPDVRVGDTATWGGESLIVAEITHTLTAASAQTEVGE